MTAVIVKATPPPILIHGDTVSFRADAYRDSTEKVVEDLLKKIPGMHIGKDGSISINGQAIERILIEGDDLFKSDYAILSRNLSAEVIDKIEVINNYSDNNLLKGLVNSKSKVINLTLKKKGRKWFGNMEGGWGNDKKKSVSGNLISLLPKTKIYCFGDYNSTGRNPIPALNNNQPYPSIEDRFPKLITIYRLFNEDMDPEKINFNRAKLLSFSSTHAVYPAITVRFSGWLFSDNNHFNQMNDYQYIIPGAAIEIKEKNYYQKKDIHFNSNMDVKWALNKQSELQLSGSLKKEKATSSADIYSTGAFYYNHLDDNYKQAKATIHYTNRLSDSKAIHIKADRVTYSNEQRLQSIQYPAKQLPFTNIFSSTLFQSVSYPFGMTRVSAECISSTEPWRIITGTAYSFTTYHLHSTLDTSAFNKEAKTLPDSFMNNEIINQYHGIAFASCTRNFNKLQIGASVTANFLSASFLKPDHNLYFTPSIDLAWSRKGHKLMANYSYDNQLPAISDIHKEYLLVDHRTIEKGVSDDAQLSPVHTINIGYNYINLSKQLLGYLQIGFSKVNKGAQKRFDLSADYAISDFIRSQNSNEQIVYSIGLDKFIRPIFTGIKLKSLISVNKYQNSVNTAQSRKVQVTNNVSQLSLRSLFKGKFNYTTGSILQYGKSGEQNTTIIAAFLDIYFKFSSKLSAHTNSEYYSSYFFTDLFLDYTVLRNKLSFSLAARNLTNNTIYRNKQVSDYTVQRQQYELIPAYFLLTVNYRF